MKKGAIVTLGLFLVGAILVSSVVTSGEPFEKLFTDEQEFEPVDDASGTTSASVLMGFYDPAGNPIEERSQMSLVKSGTNQVVQEFRVRIKDIRVGGKNIDLNTIHVEAQFILLASGKEHWITGNHYRIDRFNIVGDNREFTLTAKYVSGKDYVNTFTVVVPLIGDQFGLNYKVDGFKWTFITRFLSSGMSLAGQEVKADLKQHSMYIITDWDEGQGNLYLNTDVRQASILPTTSSDLSVLFVILVIFVGLWYKWGQHWIKWN